jgi:hypothetical protein
MEESGKQNLHFEVTKMTLEMNQQREPLRIVWLLGIGQMETYKVTNSITMIIFKELIPSNNIT